ncbi:hypothetical protein BBP00_00007806, partial [Phytophthora kernoviae]
MRRLLGAIAVESAQCIAGGQNSINKFSEQQLVSCNTQNNYCNGGAPQYAFDYILENGLCMDTSFPYVSGDGNVPSLKIRNSWSDSWGDGGYIRLKRAFSRACIELDHTLTVRSEAPAIHWISIPM